MRSRHYSFFTGVAIHNTVVYTDSMSHPQEFDFIDIDVCPDCLVWHTYGDPDMVDEDDLEVVAAAVGIDPGYDVQPGADGDDDGHFSKSPCDACRRPLGGMRYPATMMAALPVPADRTEEN